MPDRKYKRAKTGREKAFRLAIGGVGGILMVMLYFPIFLLFSALDPNSPIVKVMLIVLILGLPLGLAIALELGLGRRDHQR